MAWVIACPRRAGPLPVARVSAARDRALLLERYSACEIDFESGFWMDYPFAERLGEASEHDVALSVHAPLFGFMGHLEASGRKFTSAVGALDRSAGSRQRAAPSSSSSTPASSSGGAEDAIDAVVEQLETLRERLAAKQRAVPFGVEVMGRVRDLGSIDDVVEISVRLDGFAPCSTSRTCTRRATGPSSSPSRSRRRSRRRTLSWNPRHPFHIHFSDIAFANRNETKHLPYGEGTLRAEPLATRSPASTGPRP